MLLHCEKDERNQAKLDQPVPQRPGHVMDAYLLGKGGR